MTRIRSSNLGRRKKLPLLQKSTPTLGAHPVSYSTGSGGSLQWAGRPGSNVHSPPSSVEMKNEWNCTSTVFMTQIWAALHFDNYVNRTTYSGFAYSRSDGSRACNLPLQSCVAYGRGYVPRNASLGESHKVYLHKPRQYSIAYNTPRLYGIAYCF